MVGLGWGGGSGWRWYRVKELGGFAVRLGWSEGLQDGGGT